jgi:hypothetical protein
MTGFPLCARLAALVALVLFAAAPVSSAATERTLYAFPTGGSKGCYPVGTLLRDGAGALYGATFDCGTGGYGTVFKLVPPLAGQTTWSVSVLHGFSEDVGGGALNANLVMDANGAVYGTAGDDGEYVKGVVFRLNPPAAGQTNWTETVLHAFDYNFAYNIADGSGPNAVISDNNGVLYGTTYRGGSTADPSGLGFGTVFKLAPPIPGQTNWQETVLYRFNGGTDGQNPLAPLTRDGSGALYGTTFSGGGSQNCVDQYGYVVGCGTIFKLTPPLPGFTNWEKVTLHRFAGGADGTFPLGKLLLDGSGNVYGTTTQGGNSQCADGIGNIVGCGTVFKLIPPAPGQTAWTKTVIHHFTGVPDGASPQGGVIIDTAGNLYGTTFGAGTDVCRDDLFNNVGCGTVFKLSPPMPGQTGWTERVLYDFQGQGDGWEPVGELVADPHGNLLGVSQLGGDLPSGYGTVFEITP